MADFCTENEIELWWSMRMNDSNDMANPDLLSDFKREHPILLLGSATSHRKYGKWTAVDYAASEIHNIAKSAIMEVVGNIDVKGVELEGLSVKRLLLRDAMIHIVPMGNEK